MGDTQIRSFKDFLLLYNQISETCFKRCANTFLSREISVNEDHCVQNCAQKHINANHKVMEIYVEVQPILVEKRVKEINSAQALLEEKAKAESQQDNSSLPETQSMSQTPVEKVQLEQNIEQAVQ